ncbi:MAG: hypothetical protein JW797_06025 [Bradymonadales bacterium]|nr:hypothetical protein [Bradymonadales bacterium]
MSINITIPLDALNDAKVARTMAELMLALGHVKAEGLRKQEGAALLPLPEQPATPAPATAPRRGRGRPPKPKTPAAPPPAQPPLTGTLKEQFDQFMERLPDQSRKFLDLVRDRKVLTMSEAMEGLGVTIPKTMGGITGSIGRWAPLRGLPVPYVAGKNDKGERIWTWTLEEVGQPQKRKRGRPPKAKTEQEGQVAAPRRPRGRPPKKPAAPAEPSEPSEPEPIVILPDETLAEGAREIFEDERYKDFLDDMRDLSRRFLLLLSRKGEVTLSEALAEFGLTGANAMGGVIGPLKRRARDFGLAVPFVVSTNAEGERIWQWRNPLRKGRTTPPQTEEPQPAEVETEEESTEAGASSFSGVRRRRKGDTEATPL